MGKPNRGTPADKRLKGNQPVELPKPGDYDPKKVAPRKMPKKK